MGEISDPSNDDGNGDDKVRSTPIVAFLLFFSKKSFVFSNYAFPPFGQSDEDRADELQANTTTPHRLFVFLLDLFILSPANSHGKGMHSSIRTISRSSDDPTDDH